MFIINIPPFYGGIFIAFFPFIFSFFIFLFSNKERRQFCCVIHKRLLQGNCKLSGRQQRALRSIQKLLRKMRLYPARDKQIRIAAYLTLFCGAQNRHPWAKTHSLRNSYDNRVIFTYFTPFLIYFLKFSKKTKILY